MRYTRLSKSSFTLIELLVVIGIIAILIALLFPVLTSVQDRANKTKCLSNVHQIAVAGAVQFGEARDKMPWRSDATRWGDAAERLLPYVKNVKETFSCPASAGQTNDFCKMPDFDFYTDYEMNGYLCSFGSVTRSQNKITDFSVAAYAYDFPYNTNLVASTGPCSHDGGINCAYLDGHAAWLPNSLMGPLNGDTPDTFFKKGWVQ